MQNKDDMIDYVLVNRVGHYRDRFKISSNHPFFHVDTVYAKADEECITFTIPTIDDAKRGYTPVRIKNSAWTSFTIVNEHLEPGKFVMDEEESDEDSIVVYFKEQLNEENNGK